MNRCKEKGDSMIMRRHMKTKQMAKGLAALFTASLVMMNAASVFAAETGEAEAVAEEAEETTALQPFFISGEDDNTYTGIDYSQNELDGIMPLLGPNEIASGTWTIDAGKRHVSDVIYLKAGQKVSMAAMIVPTTVKCWLGLMRDSNGDVQCIEGTKSLAYTFEAPANGNYRVMVQNKGTGQTVTASVTYYYH